MRILLLISAYKAVSRSCHLHLSNPKMIIGRVFVITCFAPVKEKKLIVEFNDPDSVAMYVAYTDNRMSEAATGSGIISNILVDPADHNYSDAW